MQQRIKRWSKNAFFRARMTPSQSIMVTDGALTLDSAIVIFVDPGVQIDETTEFSYHSCCVPYTMSLVVHISKMLPGSAHPKYASLQHSCFRRYSVATRLRCGGILIIFYSKFSAERTSERILKIR